VAPERGIGGQAEVGVIEFVGVAAALAKGAELSPVIVTFAAGHTVSIPLREFYVVLLSCREYVPELF
jgi:hypothetical protein